MGRRLESAAVRGYVELAEPVFKTALLEFAKTQNRILIFPLFLFASNHVKNDIPLILSDLKEKFPNHRFISAMPLGIHENIIRFEVGDTYVFLPQS